MRWGKRGFLDERFDYTEKTYNVKLSEKVKQAPHPNKRDVGGKRLLNA